MTCVLAGDLGQSISSYGRRFELCSYEVLYSHLTANTVFIVLCTGMVRFSTMSLVVGWETG